MVLYVFACTLHCNETAFSKQFRHGADAGVTSSLISVSTAALSISLRGIASSPGLVFTMVSLSEELRV